MNEIEMSPAMKHAENEFVDMMQTIRFMIRFHAKGAGVEEHLVWRMVRDVAKRMSDDATH